MQTHALPVEHLWRSLLGQRLVNRPRIQQHCSKGRAGGPGKICKAGMLVHICVLGPQVGLGHGMLDSCCLGITAHWPAVLKIVFGGISTCLTARPSRCPLPPAPARTGAASHLHHSPTGRAECFGGAARAAPRGPPATPTAGGERTVAVLLKLHSRAGRTETPCCGIRKPTYHQQGRQSPRCRCLSKAKPHHRLVRHRAPVSPTK